MNRVCSGFRTVLSPLSLNSLLMLLFIRPLTIPHPLAITDLFSIPIVLPFPEFQINRSTQHTVFWVWLLLFSILYLDLSTLWTLIVIPFYCWVCSFHCPLYGCITDHFSICQVKGYLQLGYLQLFTVCGFEQSRHTCLPIGFHVNWVFISFG